MPDIFKLTKEQIARLDGFNDISANNIIHEIEKLKDSDIKVSEFFGALGIPGISEKKCRLVFNAVDVNTLLDNHIKRSNKQLKLLGLPGINTKTADTFLDFIEENRDMIKELIREIKIVPDGKYKGNVVFTGFRDAELGERILDAGYEVSETINSDTVAVVCANTNTTKAKQAADKCIPMYLYGRADDLVSDLKNGTVKAYKDIQIINF
jgi:NAD-dependent DNA ligase